MLRTPVRCPQVRVATYTVNISGLNITTVQQEVGNIVREILYTILQSFFFYYSSFSPFFLYFQTTHFANLYSIPFLLPILFVISEHKLEKHGDWIKKITLRVKNRC